MLCPKCGSKNQTGRKYCANCKALLKQTHDSVPDDLQVAADHRVSPTPQIPAHRMNVQRQSPLPAVEMTLASSARLSETAGSLHEKDVASKRGHKVIMVGIIAAVLIAVFAAVFTLDIFDFRKVAEKNAVNDYTWEELSEISSEIAKTTSESEAIAIARRYGLVNQSGQLDGMQTKQVNLSDGKTVEVQIAGFLHDTTIDGGKAGITFIFSDAISRQSMNEIDTNLGGWEKSQMRSWLNTDGLAMLPEDLQRSILEVNKKTNNAGETKSVSSVTYSSDKLWLYSSVELCGDSDWFSGPAGNAVLNAEGTEYLLFRNGGTRINAPSALFTKQYDNKDTWWWLRSSNPHFDDRFFDSNNSSSTSGSTDCLASGIGGVVPGFCI